ncbi:helix-turn-helix domain-containing protein [Agrobacterium tumefaciens]|uniref:helix-turn-helix domain-containing protein n=1 Tax=Agrobacterium tumefaciens TaxID=358 RepID=UPI00157440B0|nr:helix-turn-helix transcriptional regulator [Agrobacterium tumefaciens]
MICQPDPNPLTTSPCAWRSKGKRIVNYVIELRGLTAREREVLGWAAKGKTAWETSKILNISRSTVVCHRRNATSKLNASNIVHAIAEAVRRHEIQL